MDGFTPKEEEIGDHLVAAHNLFVELNDIRLNEWVTSLHNMQRILAMRILRREIPDTFNYPVKQ